MAVITFQQALDRLAAFEAATESDMGRRVSTLLGQGLTAAQKAAARANIGAAARDEVVLKRGRQTVSGDVTFERPVGVPAGSIPQDRVTDLTTDLASKLDAADIAGKADANAVVDLTTAQTVAGVKTFSSAPIVPDGSFTQAKVTGLTAALSARLLSDEIVPASKYGFVADYAGTPLYDGGDGARITCTDNTAAMTALLDDCIAKGDLKVFFPRGHYGIVAGQIQKDLTGCNLTLIGDGMDVSVIDFVKEDATKVAYVDESGAKYIARITNANRIVIEDMWIKATTNYNNPNGNQLSNDAVYYGAVWGLILDKFDTLKCSRVQISQFNYRGISTMVTGGTTYAQMSKKIELHDCNFHDNKGSGLWARSVQEVEIVGGEFHHNGQLGVPGTGYGVTCSTKVGYLIARGGARFHHNYRKGLDTHGGVNLHINGASFEDNVLYHFAALGWDVITTTGDISVSNVVMSNGYTSTSRTWLEAAYTAMQAISSDQKTGLAFTIDERVQGAPAVAPIRNVKFNNVKILAHYGGMEKNPNLNRYALGSIYALTGTTSFVDCDFELSGLTISSTNAYGSSIMERICARWDDRNFRIKVPVSQTYGSGKFGSVYISNVPTSISWDNVNLNLVTGYVFGQTSAGEIINTAIGDAVIRKFTHCTLEWDVFPPVSTTHPNILGNISYSSTPNLTSMGNIARVGQTKFIIPQQALTEFERAIYNWGAGAVTAGTPFMEIILEKVTYCTFELTLNLPGANVGKTVFTTTGVDNQFLTVHQTAEQYTVTVAEFVDADSIERTKITLTASVAVAAGMRFGTLQGYGYMYSWGINRVVAI